MGNVSVWNCSGFVFAGKLVKSRFYEIHILKWFIWASFWLIVKWMWSLERLKQVVRLELVLLRGSEVITCPMAPVWRWPRGSLGCTLESKLPIMSSHDSQQCFDALESLEVMLLRIKRLCSSPWQCSPSRDGLSSWDRVFVSPAPTIFRARFPAQPPSSKIMQLNQL